MSVKRFPYGGQAVLEGVMMRGLRQASVAVRHPSGEIVFKHEPLNVQRRHAWENLPFLRGVLMLWDALNLGTRALNFSASVALSAEEKPDGGAAAKPPSDAMITGTMIVSLLFGIGLFFILPTLLASLADRLGATSFVREGLKSALQLGIFVGYIVAIGRMPEVARLFGFHGAEHKAINAYEAGAPLTVERVREFTLIHPRCGTSFLLVVLLINWIISFLLVRDWPLWARVLSHIPLIPLIAAISYELLRLSAANYHRAWVRVLVAPSLLFQKLTTREPDDQMLAVAIAALLPVLAADGITLPEYDTRLAGGVGPLSEPLIEPKQVLT
ncbi:MAG TPA: DUF1385 domain-containing protein [Roseiflexaceae bacterium]|nr:DUF1385 domain-containing protein [Roseiflexaceae bacterium]